MMIMINLHIHQIRVIVQFHKLKEKEQFNNNFLKGKALKIAQICIEEMQFWRLSLNKKVLQKKKNFVEILEYFQVSLKKKKND